jgi:hypothetical protein
MKKSKGLFYAGIAGIVVVLVVAVAVIMMSKRPGGGDPAPADGTVRIICLGGSEKEDLINDPDVKRILHDKYGIEVDFNASGSYKQVQIPAEELKADKIDCLWPSSASAQAIFEGSGTSKAFGTDYEAASVLQSPEVLYANKEAADGLQRAGIVQVRDNAYFIVDLRKLLDEYLLPSKSWADLGVTLPSGPVLINSSNPATSNSGMTLAQLELATVASGKSLPTGDGGPIQRGAGQGESARRSAGVDAHRFRQRLRAVGHPTNGWPVGGLREPAAAVDHHTHGWCRSRRNRDALPGADDLSTIIRFWPSPKTVRN